MAGLDRKRTTNLLAVVAVAVGLGLVASIGDVGRRDVEPADLGARAAAALAGVAVGTTIAAIVVAGAVVAARRWRVPLGRSALTLLLAAGAVVGGAGAVDLTNRDRPAATTELDEPASADGQQAPTAPGARPTPDDGDERGLAFDVDVEGTAILLVALGLLIAAIVFFGRRTELRTVGREGVYLASDLSPLDPDPTDDPVPDRRLGEALEASLAALDASGAPAERIRAAYGTMLQRFESIGLGRHPSEPPGAYVGRCLRSRALPRQEVERLLALFELARFSRAVLDERDVDAARAALRATIDALRIDAARIDAPGSATP